MNKSAKGNRLELKAQKILEKDGWLVHRQHRKIAGWKTFFNKKTNMLMRMPIMAGADIFGADIIAIMPEDKLVVSSKSHRKWINVTTVPHKSAKIKEFEKWPWIGSDWVEVWCDVPRKGFRIFRYPTWEEI